jgi:hypothetical protein
LSVDNGCAQRPTAGDACFDHAVGAVEDVGELIRVLSSHEIAIGGESHRFD